MTTKTDNAGRISTVIEAARDALNDSYLNSDASYSNNLALQWVQAAGMFKMLLDSEKEIFRIIAPLANNALNYRLQFSSIPAVLAEVSDYELRYKTVIMAALIPELDYIDEVQDREQQKIYQKERSEKDAKEAAEELQSRTCKFCGKVAASKAGLGIHRNKCESEKFVKEGIWTDYQDVKDKFWFDMNGGNIIKRD